MHRVDGLRAYYDANRPRMEEFVRTNKARGQSSDDKELFRSLCLNILAPRVKWEKAEGAVSHLEDHSLLFQGDEGSVRAGLEDFGYRLTNTADYVCRVRERFYSRDCNEGIVDYVGRLRDRCREAPIDTRNEVARRSCSDHIPGLGMKQVSHFLRGLGFSQNKLAILDTIVTEELKLHGVIEEVPEILTRHVYLEIEEKEREWATDVVDIPLDVLDLVLWEMGRQRVGSC